MDLSIIIVNWNSKEYLRKCISSIRKNTTGMEYEIIVIDGGSFDGCRDMLRKNFPCVHFIQSDKNVGFSRANNVAYKVSKGRHILFLNPDTEIEQNAVQILLNNLKSIPNAGALGGKLLNSDRSLQTSCIQSFPTILNQALDLGVLRKCFKRWSLWGMSPLFEDNATASEVQAVSGACLMIKRKVFEEVGMFSNDFFMYSEDIDLCFKLSGTGYRNYYIPDAVVVHHGGTSSAESKVSVFSSVMQLESQCRFFRRTRSKMYCWKYRLAMGFVSCLRLGIILSAWPIFKIRGNPDPMERAFKKWLSRLRWTLGLESWVKKY